MKQMTQKAKKRWGIASLVLFVLLFCFLTVFLWEPFVSLFRDPEGFRLWVEKKGWGARSIFVLMVVLQVIVALIPGEPLEIAAGFAFGSVEGTLLTMVGIAVGSTLVFLFVRIFGVKLVELFFPLEKIRNLRILQKERRFEFLVFLIMLIPGTPKDLISYFAGLTRMSLGHWLLLTTVARIPSVVTSTVGGNALGEQKYLFAVLVFSVTVTISLFGAFLYDRITRRKEKKAEKKEK